jgi:hypothetical protein
MSDEERLPARVIAAESRSRRKRGTAVFGGWPQSEEREYGRAAWGATPTSSVRPSHS